MNNDRAAYHEIEHTADLGIEVTAPDFATLIATAGEALYAQIADPQTIEIRETISLSVSGDGPEELLHAWLCELLARFNINGFIAKRCAVGELTHDRVDGAIKGEKLDLARHRFHTEIKGVTYHDFKVWEENGSWHARVIFDV
jgi:SHS2 domain-containing protein